jgi:hypothetical protein
MKKFKLSSTFWSKLHTLAFIAVGSTFFAGCGSVNDALNATKSMPGYMLNLTDATNAMKNQGTATAEDLRLQKLDTGLQRMTDPANTKYLTPAPFKMFAGAEIAGEAITADELIKLTFVLLTGIDKQTPDDSAKVVDPKTGKLDFPDELKNSTDQKKYAELAEVELLAAFTPEDKINEVIQTQILSHGPYEPWAYPLLMARINALDSYLIEESILNTHVVNVAQVELAVSRAEFIAHILRQPFVSKIKLSTYGMLIPDDNISLSADPNLISQLKAKLLRAATTQLDAATQQSQAFLSVVNRINAL